MPATFRFWGAVDPRGRRKAPLIVDAVPGTQTSEDGTSTMIRLYEPIDSWGEFWGVSAREFIEALDTVQTPNIHLHINSPGGEVYEAIAVLNALRSHPAKVTAVVDGLAASAASFIAAGADELAMSPNTELMIHDPWGLGIGNAADFRDLAARLDHIGDNIASIYAAKAGNDPGVWREAMLAETWYSADEAVAVGLADRVLGDNTSTEDGATAANKWDRSMFRNRNRAAAPAPLLLTADERERRDRLVAAVRNSERRAKQSARHGLPLK